MPSGSSPLALPPEPTRLLNELWPVIRPYTEPLDITIGSGTALAARWHHRKSNDIDLFLPNSRDLHQLAAQRSELLHDLRSHNNDISAFIQPDESAVAHPCYPTIITWMHSNARTTEPLSNQYEPITNFPLETNTEILSKKFHYRILQQQLILPKDVFDLAWSIRYEPNTFREVCQPYPTVHLFGIRQNLRLLADTWQLAHPDAAVEEPSDPELARNCLEVLIDELPERPGGPQR